MLALGSIHTRNPEVAEKLRTEVEYFQTNTERMRYPKFRKQHLFVGSGVVEAGCKTVVGSRLKRSGMFWTVAGANAILGPTLLLPQRTLRGLLGGSPCRLSFHFCVAHPPMPCAMRSSCRA